MKVDGSKEAERNAKLWREGDEKILCSIHAIRKNKLSSSVMIIYSILTAGDNEVKARMK